MCHNIGAERKRCVTYKTRTGDSINVLALPSEEVERDYLDRIRRGWQHWDWFQDWPEGAYRFDLIAPYQIPLFSTLVERRIIKCFVAQGIRAFIRSRQYDVMIAHGEMSVLLIAILRRLIPFKAKIVVFDIGSFGRATRGIKYRLIKYMAKSIDLVIYHASVHKEYYDRYLPDVVNRSSFIPLGVNFEKKRLSWSDSNKGNYVVVLTSNCRRMDHECLIKAWARIDSRYDVKLRIYGVDDHKLHGIRASSIPASVELCPYTPSETLSPIVENARFALLPLTECGHSKGQLTLLFLLGLGTATICSKTTGIVDYIHGGLDGLAYEPGNCQMLVDRIAFALENPDLMKDLGRTAYEFALREYNRRKYSLHVYGSVKELLR